MISVQAAEMNDTWTGGEKILVQGIIDAYFDLLTDVAVRCKNGVLDMKEHNYSDERISLLAGKTGFMHSKKS